MYYLLFEFLFKTNSYACSIFIIYAVQVSKKKESATKLRRKKVTVANKKELMHSTDEKTGGTTPQEQKLDISNIALVKMIKHGFPSSSLLLVSSINFR